ncbi:DUF1735 domain-containing protein [Echinicola sp. 20G]|uniref:DUF1735 domain-containing protein n=1 Tax=Echinicola sp. 20G TaxID=2781961 RepID=UPI001910B714|nr:DUF1735 domain-containing protein [Echinicola sp. 20G]
MKKHINKLAVFGLMLLGLTSCLDEDPLFDPDQVENVVEFFDIGAIAAPGSVHPLYISSFDAVDAVELELIISYSGAHDNPTDIVVDFEVDEAALEAYNEDQGTHFEVLPSDLYTIDGMSVTIPAGQRQVTKTVTLMTSQFDFSKSYALPLTITNSSYGTISGNFNTAIYAVVAKNKYDGVYEVTGEFVDVNFPAFYGYYPYEVELQTQSANTVARYDYALGGLGYVFNTGSGLSYYGSYAAIFQFDDSDNVSGVVNYYGQPAGNGREAALNPDGVNKFVEVSADEKTIDVSYYMIQNGALRCTFVEHYTYVGPR